MQSAVIEYARNVIGFKDANSTEMNKKTSYPVIDLMEKQKEIQIKGGTMRLGSYDCSLMKDSKSFLIYNKTNIKERHRHRYEFNNIYKSDFEKAGMITTGINKENNLVEIVEIPSHQWFVGVQFHPEYKSTVSNPHPLFVGFINACIKNKK